MDFPLLVLVPLNAREGFPKWSHISMFGCICCRRALYGMAASICLTFHPLKGICRRFCAITENSCMSIGTKVSVWTQVFIPLAWMSGHMIVAHLAVLSVWLAVCWFVLRGFFFFETRLPGWLWTPGSSALTFPGQELLVPSFWVFSLTKAWQTVCRQLVPFCAHANSVRHEWLYFLISLPVFGIGTIFYFIFTLAILMFVEALIAFPQKSMRSKVYFSSEPFGENVSSYLLHIF